MPEYQIDVGVEPDASTFPEKLAAAVGKAEARQDPVGVELEPQVGREFARDAQRKVKAALASLDAQVTLSPELSKRFRQDVAKLAREALAGQELEIPVQAVLGRAFRRDLQRAVKEATAGAELEIPVQAKLGPGFRAKLQRAVREELTGKPIEATVQLGVDQRSLPAFVSEISRRTAEATAAASKTGASSVELRADGSLLDAQVLAAIGAATSGASASEAGSIELRADTAGMAAQLEAEVLGITEAVSASEAGSIEVRADTGKAAAEISALGLVAADSSGGFDKLTTAATLGGLAIAGVVAASAGAGIALFQIGSSFDDAFDTIQTRTGATGAQLAGLEDDFRAVAGAVPSEFADVSDAISGVNQKLGLSGPLAQTVAARFLLLSNITGTDLSANLASASGALQSFSVPAAEIPGALDAIFRASQASGVGVDALSTSLQSSGAALRTAGFSFEESTALIAQLERAGVPAATVIGSLSIAARKLAKDGKEPAKAIGDLVEKIRDAKTPTEALALAQATFGRGAVGITDAIRAGKFELGDFLAVVQDGKGTIERTAAATADAAESWQLLKNNTKLALEVPAAEFFGQVGDSVKALAPQLRDLGPALGELVGGFASAASGLLDALGPILGELAPALAPIGRAVGDLFRAIGPSLASLVGAVGRVVGAFAPLLSVLGDVGAALFDSLVDVLDQIDLGPLVEAGGDLAVAGGEILKALLPLIPALAQIATTVASSLAPILSELAPLLGDVLAVLVPVLEQLANLAPLILVGVLVRKTVGYFVGLGKSIFAVVEQLRSLKTGTFEALNGISKGLGDKVFSGTVIAAAAAGTAIAGYMAGASDDAITSITSIGAAASGVFLAFQQGGPIGAAIAAGTFAIGALFGQAAKRAREAAAEQKAYREEVAQLRDAFDEAGVDRYSSSQAKALVVAQQLTKTLKGTDDAARLVKDAFGILGLDFEDVAVAAGKGTAGIASLNDQIETASSRRALIITQQSLDGVEQFGHLTGVAQQSLYDLQAQLQETGGPKLQTLALAEVSGSLQEFKANAKESGIDLGDLSELTKAYYKILQGNIADSPAAKYIESLPGKTKAAITEQSRLAEVQRLVAEEQERQRGSASRFSSAYDDVQASLSTATTAYKNWLTGLQGSDAPLADVKLGIIDYARQLRELASNPDLAPYEKQQKQISLVAQAQGEATDALGRFISESGGNFDVFKGKADALSLELTNGLAQSLGISTGEAAALVGQILKVPDEKQFRVLAETEDASTGLDSLNGKIAAYIGADVDNIATLQTASAEGKALLVTKLVNDYAALHPEAVAGLNIDDPKTKAALVDGILSKIDGGTATATVLLDARVTAAYKAAVDTLTRLSKNPNVDPRNLYVPGGFAGGLAVGAVVRKPTLALIGEAGPEVVLPLTDQERMLQLLNEAGVLGDISSAGALAVAGASAPIAGAAARSAAGTQGAADPAAAAGTLSLTGSTDGVADWIDQVVALLGAAGERISEASLPGFEAWRAQVDGIFGQLGTGIDSFALATVARLQLWAGTEIPAATGGPLQLWAASVIASSTQAAQGAANAWAAGLSRLAPTASLAASLAVAGMASGLSLGTGKVTTISGTYASELGKALNPILAAVGQQRLPFARGGLVPGPNVERDVVPALLMPGEVVIRKASVERFGLDQLLAINKAGQLPGYRDGGLVTGDTAGLVPEFTRRLGLFAAAEGEPFHVESGYRSIQEQVRLYAAYLNGTGNLAAIPGSSMHNYGLAVDGNHWSGRGPGRFGITYPLLSKGEPWHAEPIEARAWRAAIRDGQAGGLGAMAGLTPLPAVPAMPFRGAVADTAQAALAYAREKALAWASSQIISSPTTGLDPLAASREQEAAVWIREAMAATGVPSSWFSGLMTIARRESNYNPTAINRWDSNAQAGDPSQGLMQTIGATFRAYALPGHGQILNPVDNAIAAIRYILARYGDIANVRQANAALAPQGYAGGGQVTADGLHPMAARLGTPAMATASRSGSPTAGNGSGGRRLTIQGDVNLNVAPPSSDDPELYGMALSHRVVPVLSSVLARMG